MPLLRKQTQVCSAVQTCEKRRKLHCYVYFPNLIKLKWANNISASYIEYTFFPFRHYCNACKSTAVSSSPGAPQKKFCGEEATHAHKHFQEPTQSNAHKLIITKWMPKCLARIRYFTHKKRTHHSKTHLPFVHVQKKNSHAPPLSHINIKAICQNKNLMEMVAALHEQAWSRLSWNSA